VFSNWESGRDGGSTVTALPTEGVMTPDASRNAARIESGWARTSSEKPAGGRVITPMLPWELLKIGESCGPLGYLAKSTHGLYLAYQNLDLELKAVRWFAKYEGRSENFVKQGACIDFQFFDSLEDAQAFCEKHAQALNLAP
jgi:hypothetical protein